MGLFQRSKVYLNSGQESNFKIDCDFLQDSDWFCLACMAKERLPAFSSIEGIPCGGCRFAEYLEPFATNDQEHPVLIADDVLTTGGSMERQRHDRHAIGVVAFARGKCPDWITPLFVLIDHCQILRKEGT